MNKKSIRLNVFIMTWCLILMILSGNQYLEWLGVNSIANAKISIANKELKLEALPKLEALHEVNRLNITEESLSIFNDEIEDKDRILKNNSSGFPYDGNSRVYENIMVKDGYNVYSSQYNGKFVNMCRVEVKKTVESIGLDKDEITLLANRNKVSLIATILPVDATNKKVLWSVDNLSVATVDENGLVTAKNPGTTKITATSEDRGFAAECNVVVEPVDATDIRLDRNNLVMSTKDSSYKLISIFEPSDTTYKNAIWSVTDDTIISLNNGVIVPLKKGITEVTVFTEDKKYRDKCIIEVIEEDEDNVFWHINTVLGPNNATYPFTGIYNFKNLYIGDGVEVTSKGISQLVMNVKGTLYLGKNATIRVRNGYYPYAPASEISSLTNIVVNSDNISENEDSFRIYENAFGKGGNGGTGGDGTIGRPYTITDEFLGLNNGGNGGNGGDGGFGGGLGGVGGAGAKSVFYYGLKGEYYISQAGSDGRSGVNCAGENKDIGGVKIGAQGNSGLHLGNGGDSGGGNGGDGGAVVGDFPRNEGKGFGGGGGGGGGYGGGILSVVASRINLAVENQLSFIVSGERGGIGYSSNTGYSGKNGMGGQGGMLIVSSPNYTPSTEQWNLGLKTYGKHDIYANNGGHGIVTGNPQKVFINGEEYNGDFKVKDAIISSNMPTTMELGKKYNVTFKVTNIGTITWSGNLYMLVSGKNDPIAKNVTFTLDKNETVSQGNTIVFNAVFSAPIATGTYTTTWSMMGRNTKFGTEFKRTISVRAADTISPTIKSVVPSNN